MTIRTFWTLFIKILGVSMFIESIFIIPEALTSVFSTSTYDLLDEIIYTFILLLIFLGLFSVVLWIFLYKTHWLISKLHLDRDFDEEKIDINISYNTVLTLGIIVIGGLVIVDSLTQLCEQAIALYDQKKEFEGNPSYILIVLYFIKTIIGYVLMTNNQLVVKFIDKKNKTTNNEN